MIRGAKNALKPQKPVRKFVLSLKSSNKEKTEEMINERNDIQYDKFGAKTFVKYGNETETRYTYNPLNLRLNLQEQKTFKAVPIVDAGTGETSTLYMSQSSSISYTYDAKGNIIPPSGASLT